MKKIITLFLVLFAILILSSCQTVEECKHSWRLPTCTEPRHCATCGITEGDPKGHIWVDATCEKPKTCKTCGETENGPLGHEWIGIRCDELRECAKCSTVHLKLKLMAASMVKLQCLLKKQVLMQLLQEVMSLVEISKNAVLHYVKNCILCSDKCQFSSSV